LASISSLEAFFLRIGPAEDVVAGGGSSEAGGGGGGRSGSAVLEVLEAGGSAVGEVVGAGESAVGEVLEAGLRRVYCRVVGVRPIQGVILSVDSLWQFFGGRVGKIYKREVQHRVREG
jgi:hypothetical protein